MFHTKRKQAFLLTLLITLTLSITDLNNQPISDINSFSFQAPLNASISSVFREVMYTYSLSTSYSDQGYLYEFKITSDNPYALRPTYILSPVNMVGVCNTINHRQEIHWGNC